MRAQIRTKQNQISKCITTKSPSKVGRQSLELGYIGMSAVSIPSPPLSLPTSRRSLPKSQISHVEYSTIGSHEIIHTSSSSTSVTGLASSKHDMVCSGILDGITNLCLGVSRNSSIIEQPKKSVIRKKKTAIYPLIVCPTGKMLDNKKLILERRKMFFQKTLFRSLSIQE